MMCRDRLAGHRSCHSPFLVAAEGFVLPPVDPCGLPFWQGHGGMWRSANMGRARKGTAEQQLPTPQHVRAC